MKARRGSGIVGKNISRRRIEKNRKKRMLNIQLLAIRSLPHSSSFSKCAKRKVKIMKRYNLRI